MERLIVMCPIMDLLLSDAKFKQFPKASERTPSHPQRQTFSFQSYLWHWTANASFVDAISSQAKKECSFPEPHFVITKCGSDKNWSRQGKASWGIKVIIVTVHSEWTSELPVNQLDNLPMVINDKICYDV